jgi:hypothetical protein
MIETPQKQETIDLIEYAYLGKLIKEVKALLLQTGIGSKRKAIKLIEEWEKHNE